MHAPPGAHPALIQIFSTPSLPLHRRGRVRSYGAVVLEASFSPRTPRLPAEPHHIGNVEVRPGELQVLIEGVRVGFTVREFELFFALAERFDRVVPRPEIYELVWGAHMPYRDRSVDVFIRKVRSKLELVAPGWEYIHTHFGIGYRFAPQRRTVHPGH